MASFVAFNSVHLYVAHTASLLLCVKMATVARSILAELAFVLKVCMLMVASHFNTVSCKMVFLTSFLSRILMNVESL